MSNKANFKIGKPGARRGWELGVPEPRDRQNSKKRITAQLCQSLLASVDHIGLNVKASNEIALRCYEKLGFKTVALFNEFHIERKV